MRALCLTAAGGTNHLAVVDVAPPVLQARTDVRVGIHAAALNHLKGLPLTTTAAAAVVK